MDQILKLAGGLLIAGSLLFLLAFVNEIEPRWLVGVQAFGGTLSGAMAYALGEVLQRVRAIEIEVKRPSK